MATWLLKRPARQARLSATWLQSNRIATALSALLDEVDSLRVELTDTLVEMADRQEEITTLKEAMAKTAMDRAAVMNRGKTVEESSVTGCGEP